MHKIWLIGGVFLSVLNVFGQDMKQYISYTVPIHLKVYYDERGRLDGVYEEYTQEYLDACAISRFENTARKEFVGTIFEKVQSGEVTAYKYDMYGWNYRGDIHYETPEKYFKEPLSVDTLKYFMGEMLSYPKFDPNTGALEYDENGHQIFGEELVPYTIEDVFGLEFLEEWTIDEKTNVLSKKVIGYSPVVLYYNNGELIGTKALFFIPCEEFKTKNKTLMINYVSNTKIRNFVECDSYVKDALTEMWWYEELLPDKRTPFLGANTHAPFISSDKPLKFYDPYNSTIDPKADFPYGFEISYEEALDRSELKRQVPKFDPNTGTMMYDEYGIEIMETISTPYEVDDIISLQFVEEWFFDEETLSIQKKIKGIAPLINYFDPAYGTLIGTQALFCIRYN